MENWTNRVERVPLNTYTIIKRKQNAEEIQKDSWRVLWVTEMKPERAKNGPFPWKLLDDDKFAVQTRIFLFKYR